MKYKSFKNGGKNYSNRFQKKEYILTRRLYVADINAKNLLQAAKLTVYHDFRAENW